MCYPWCAARGKTDSPHRVKLDRFDDPAKVRVELVRCTIRDPEVVCSFNSYPSQDPIVLDQFESETAYSVMLNMGLADRCTDRNTCEMSTRALDCRRVDEGRVIRYNCLYGFREPQFGN